MKLRLLLGVVVLVLGVIIILYCFMLCYFILQRLCNIGLKNQRQYVY